MAEELNSVKELNSNIDSLNETIKSMSAPSIDLGKLVREKLMPTRRCIKKMLMSQCNNMDEVSAHIIVYGHNDVNDETVKEGYAMKANSEVCRKVDKMKDDLVKSATTIGNEMGRAVMEQVNLTAAASSSLVAAADQMKTVPPQPSAALHTYLSLNQLVTQVAQSFTALVPALGPLSYIPFVIDGNDIDGVVSPINSAISTIDTSLKAISSIKVP